jgi:hypothetical protein
MLALHSFHPKADVRFPFSDAFRFQLDEYSMFWESVYTSFFDDESSDFDSFWQYFMEHACRRPKRIAIEEKPHALIVCARYCKRGRVPVFQLTHNGTRVRSCQKPSNVV